MYTCRRLQIICMLYQLWAGNSVADLLSQLFRVLITKPREESAVTLQTTVECTAVIKILVDSDNTSNGHHGLQLHHMAWLLQSRAGEWLSSGTRGQSYTDVCTSL